MHLLYTLSTAVSENMTLMLTYIDRYLISPSSSLSEALTLVCSLLLVTVALSKNYLLQSVLHRLINWLKLVAHVKLSQKSIWVLISTWCGTTALEDEFWQSQWNRKVICSLIMLWQRCETHIDCMVLGLYAVLFNSRGTALQSLSITLTSLSF